MTQRRPPTAAAGEGDGPVAGRGAQGRVAAVHVQTRRGLLVAAGFMLAAVVAVVTGSGWWLPLHLFVVGGLLSAISTTTQMLAVTWSASPAPTPLVAGIQRWSLALGVVALVVGHERDVRWLFIAGGAAVVAAMAALVPILWSVRQEAVTARYGPAIVAYVAAVLLGAVGMSLGILLGTGNVGDRFAEVRGAHLVLNLFGLVGLVIAGTLPYFTATQVRSKMSRRATPTTMRATFLALAAATAIAAIGRIVDRPGVAAGGLIVYAIGLVVVAALLPVYGRRRLEWAGPRAVQLLAGLAWWTAMTVALAIATARRDDDRAILEALVIGGLAQILVASLAYLGPVLRGGGHQRLTAGFALTRSWLSLVAANVAALGILFGHDRIAAVALVVWAGDLVTRAALLLTGKPRNEHV
jgi:nitrite reductase (NO-forming)